MSVHSVTSHECDGGTCAQKPFHNAQLNPVIILDFAIQGGGPAMNWKPLGISLVSAILIALVSAVPALAANVHLDRKSTRLNSSHRTISYAVFCLKKKSQN